MAFPPKKANLSNRLPAVSFLSISIIYCFNISPVSSPVSISMVLIPVFSNPSITAHCIGAAPLYAGNKEACIFIQARRGISRTSFGNIFP